MVAVLTSARLVRSLLVGGAFSLQTWLGWSAVIAAQQDHGPGLAAVWRARGRKVARALQHLPVGEADQVAVGRPLGWWQEWLAHPDPDDRYWQRLDYAAAVATATVPVAMVTSWHDLFLPGNWPTGRSCRRPRHPDGWSSPRGCTRTSGCSGSTCGRRWPGWTPRCRVTAAV
jgi:predicted acyl esterase